MSNRPRTSRRVRLGATIGATMVGALAIAMTTAPSLYAHPDSTDPSSSGDPARPQFADLIEEVQPAVVNITATRSMAMPASRPNPLENDPRLGPNMDELLRRFFGQGMRPMFPNPQPAQAVGSGFVIDAGGHVVTNHHVIENATEIQVILFDGRALPAELIGTDPKTDLAVLRVEAEEDLTAVDFGDSDDIRVGDWVVAIGNPFGLGGTATAGIVSARGRDIRSGPFDDFIQIDAPINQGNSGGPVFDTDGEVIGVNTAIFSPNGGNVGIGFAIPAAQARTVVEQLISSGHVSRGWLGVQIQSVTPDIAKSLELDIDKGALVAAVAPDSPASRAGVEVADIIVEFAGKPVTDTRELVRLVAGTQPEKKVRLKVWREGREVELGALIIAMEDETDSGVATAGNSASPIQGLGMTLVPLTNEIRARLLLAEDVQGVVVTQVQPGSPAAQQGLRAGDVITHIGRHNVVSPNDVTRQIESATADGEESILVLVRRGEAQRFVALNLA